MGKIIITGASDGIGAATAKQLKDKAFDVVIVGRNPQKTKAIANSLKVPYHLADFSDLSQVVKLAEELSVYDTIDVLVNNAGGIMGERTVTRDGFEKTFQVNHLAPFLLTNLLLDKLVLNKTRVINTASIAANAFGKNFDVTDLNNEKNYAPHTAYGYGKLENILFTRELSKRYADKGIETYAFHPGVVRSNFAKETTHFMRFIYHSPLKYLTTISSEKSASFLLNLVLGHPTIKYSPGEVYFKDKVMPVDFQDSSGKIAVELWNKSEDMLQQKGLL